MKIGELPNGLHCKFVVSAENSSDLKVNVQKFETLSDDEIIVSRITNCGKDLKYYDNFEYFLVYEMDDDRPHKFIVDTFDHIAYDGNPVSLIHSSNVVSYDRRKFIRHTFNTNAIMSSVRTGSTHKIRIQDISIGGLGIIVPHSAAIKLGDLFSIDLNNPITGKCSQIIGSIIRIGNRNFSNEEYTAGIRIEEHNQTIIDIVEYLYNLQIKY